MPIEALDFQGKLSLDEFDHALTLPDIDREELLLVVEVVCFDEFEELTAEVF